MINNKLTYLIAVLLLSAMFTLAFLSLRDDTLTFDETAHIAAGYSYLTKLDMRLNPEHPPLVKDLSALPLLFLNLNFSDNDPSWLQEQGPQWWLQFDFANRFIYKIGNDPEQIIFWSRLSMLIILVLFGWFVFFWSKKLFGNCAALLSLTLFAFSPSLLAHGRLVATDVGAAFSVCLAIYFWLQFLRKPCLSNVALATFSLALAMLVKFSFVLLGPVFVVTALLYALVSANKNRLKNVFKYALLGLLIGISSIVFIVWPVYQVHIWNFPQSQQIRDIKFNLEPSVIPRPLVALDLWLASHRITRPAAHFLMGILMAINRSSTGNTTYFTGQISNQGFKSYFPIIYLIKEPITLHLLTAMAVLYLFLMGFSAKAGFFRRLGSFFKLHLSELTMLLFTIFYWLISINSKLNIGVRHLLPIFPFVFILTGGIVARWLKSTYFKKTMAGALVLLFGWQMLGSIRIFPHFLAYYNELVGGPKNGYKYAVDSNYDWGQDLKRLKNWLDEREIKLIYIDYFGGGDLDYYLGPDRYSKWESQKKPADLPRPGWLAVSANQRQGGQARPVKGYDRPTDYYKWLEQYEPEAAIGYSIFVYRIP